MGYTLFNKDKILKYKPEQFKEIQKKVLGESTNNPNVSGELQQNLQIEDIKVGEGDEVKQGDTIMVNYTGTLQDGTIFDSNTDPENSLEVTLETGKLIEGWVQGVPGMKVGGTRKLTIPPQLGYGEQSLGKIPASSTLIFEVTVLEIKK
ncbi:peptidylprolyl isomerase [candidate division WWE3 bacterium CG10_big_fil_rev_8_21_14_0_10_32_10]|uniref:Peptidyl-prolyl cis-trans isomerase n=1 Tax=candidate division WWE3 bacterium CG10_big_fil_rev_8_21_14_0_10_32_10 TaxID=1975090 RepID=A0A2H0R9B3_UNCKA|nr:MAG: peptidylprolyl isomerase [candidate division WWE3 bacterium CG10_big_fil_rev_8_21_14_0_10_32_10]